MGITIKPFERDDHVTVIVPRQQKELGGRFLRILRALEIGEQVLVEAYHFATVRRFFNTICITP